MKKDYTRPEEVEACKQWLKAVQAKKTKTIRSNHGSGYGFKHDVENWLSSDANPEQGMYISEDSFNQAMRDSKFRLEPRFECPYTNMAGEEVLECSSFYFNISFSNKKRELR